MNPKKRIMEFLNNPKWARVEDNPDDTATEDRRKVQQIIDGMSLGTATLVIDHAVGGKHLENYEIKDLENVGRYYTATIVGQNGHVIQKLLVDKQTGDVRFV